MSIRTCIALQRFPRTRLHRERKRTGSGAAVVIAVLANSGNTDCVAQVVQFLRNTAASFANSLARFSRGESFTGARARRNRGRRFNTSVADVSAAIRSAQTTVNVSPGDTLSPCKRKVYF